MLLFVVLFYVYPLKFLFTAAFSFFIPGLGIRQLSVTRPQLARIFAIYGAGYVVLFTMFALLYLQAYRSGTSCNLTPLEVFDTRASLGAHWSAPGSGSSRPRSRSLRRCRFRCSPASPIS